MELPLKDEECIICFEPLELGDIATLNCKSQHKFHSKCIGEWFLSKNNKERICPLCITEKVEVISIKPSVYGDNWNYLFINEKHRKRPDTPPPLYHELQPLQNTISRQRRNSIEVDDCCYPFCNII